MPALTHLCRDTGRTIIFTTHHLDEAEALSDRVAFLEQGRLRCCAPPFCLTEAYGQGLSLTLIKQVGSWSKPASANRQVLILCPLWSLTLPESERRPGTGAGTGNQSKREPGCGDGGVCAVGSAAGNMGLGEGGRGAPGGLGQGRLSCGQSHWCPRTESLVRGGLERESAIESEPLGTRAGMRNEYPWAEQGREPL